jgi:hypothetical protein
MNETFRLSKSYRDIFVVFLVVFLALLAAVIFAASKEPSAGRKLNMAIGLGGFPLMMVACSILMIVEHRRHGLTIQGTRVVLRRISRPTEFDLREVTVARWRFPGNLVLRSGSARVVIHLPNYDPEARERIEQYLRSTIDPAVQTGWNLMVYKLEMVKRRATGKPGPDEVLVRRENWSRYFAPCLVATGVVVFAYWSATGNVRPFAALLMPLAAWASLRFTTPAEGMLAKKISLPATAEGRRFLGFLIVWIVVGAAGLATHTRYQAQLVHASPVMVAGILIWYAAFIFEFAVLGRRQSRREREAAELAAKTRGELRFDSWQRDC